MLSVYARLFFAVFIASWSSIIIRWIGDVDALVIAFYRLIISAVILLPFSFSYPQHNRINLKRFKGRILFAGGFLALHFFTWITSLQLTTVGNSIFLESTHPIFALLLSMVFLKERGSIKLLPALVLGLAGMYVMVSTDFDGGAQALYGDFLAILAAVALAAYLIIARSLKSYFPLMPYLFAVYASAAAFLFIVILIKGVSFWALSSLQWFLVFLLAVGPNLIGHSLLNWASRHIPVYKVNMALLGESILATIFAALLLDEIPQTKFYFGAILILAAIVQVFWRRAED